MMKLMFMYFLSLFMLVFINMNNFYCNLCFFSLFILLFLFKFNMDFLISSSYMGLDSFSYPLILMTVWILGLMIMSLNQFDSMKVFFFFLMLIILIFFFLSLNMMMMYVFFELSLIPTYFMIVFWGSNPERLSASFYLLIYMLLISLPLLFYIMKIVESGSLSFSVMAFNNLIFEGWWNYIIIMGAFFVKLPLYIFHLWLPKAHVEAPVYGSMILASVLLKLGGYGLYRIISVIKVDLNNHELIISISLTGGLMVSLLSMLQVDMKSLVAYSSVAHMNLMVAGLLTLTKMGLSSSLLIMISHGVCSSGLFYMVNLYYERTSSRLLILNKGMINLLPMMALWWFFFCSSNFSYPLSLNFIGEIILLMSILSWDLSLSLIMILVCFFSSAYSLYLFSYIQHGSSSLVLSYNISGSLIKEFMVVNFHYFMLLFILLDLLFFY